MYDSYSAKNGKYVPISFCFKWPEGITRGTYICIGTLSITEKYKSISENYTSTITYLELTYHFALFKIRSSIRHPSARSTSQGRKKVLKSRGQEVMWWA